MIKKFDLLVFVKLLKNNFISFFQILFLSKKKESFLLINFFGNLKRIVWNCLPITSLSIGAMSVIYAIHMAPEFSVRGMTIYIGGLMSLALIRESAPVMGALAIITQYCTGMTAEIGSMKISEQLDAMKISKVSPEKYILFPMVMAGVIGFPIIIIICAFFGIFIGYLVSSLTIDMSPKVYLTSIKAAVLLSDIFMLVVKSMIFGFFSCLVSYTAGVQTRGGSKALGKSTRFAVVINFALIIILDYLITAFWLN